MPASPTADTTARLLLRYAREPSRFRTEARGADAALVDTDVVMRLALGRDAGVSGATIDGARDGALRDAAIGYVREVFFRPDASPYQTLGLAPDASQDAVKERFRLLMLLVHPDRQGTGAPWPDACAAQANRAYGILRDPASRAAYDREERERAAAAKVAREAAVAKAASMRAHPARAAAARGPRRPPGPPVLPEWLTAGVGGWVREHPAGAALGALVAAAVLVIGAALWEGESGSLVRASRPANPDDRAAPAPKASLVAEAAPPVAPSIPAATAPPPAAPPPIAPSVQAEAAVPPASGRIETVAVPIRGESAPPRPQAPPAGPIARGGRMAEPVTVPPPRPSVPPAGIAAAAPTPVPESPRAAAPVPAPPAAVAAAPEAEPVRVAAAPAPAPVAPPAAPAVSPTAPSTDELEVFFARFVDAYDRGHADLFASMFDRDAQANQRLGRAAIRGEYDDLFRQTAWRRMQLTRIDWRRAGEVARAKGEIAVTMRWRDGRQAEERYAVDMELARRDGRVVITRYAHSPSPP